MFRYSGVLAGASLLALVAPAAPSFAAAADTEKIEYAALDAAIVVTGIRPTDESARAVARTPGGADLVSGDEYRNKLAVSLRDALAFSPGVYAQPRFGQEVRLSIRGSGLSRGFHMRGLTLLQDGIPINLADDNGDFQELDPMIFQHLEVYRGSNALRFGGSTLGGAINGVTPTGLNSPGFDLRLDGGSFNTVRGKAAVGVASGRGDAWLALTADHSDGERDHAERRSLRFHGNVGVQVGEAVETRFYASVQDIKQELPGALDLATALTAPKSGTFVGDQARDIRSLRVQNRTSFAFGSAALEIGAFLNAKELNHPIFQFVDQQSTDYGGFARLNWNGGPIEATIGATARAGEVDSRRYVNLDGRRGALRLDADQEAYTIDLYGEARYRPTPNLTLIAGSLYTRGGREQDQHFPTEVHGAASFHQLSPKFGILWEPTSEVQVYANFSRSAELPGFIELAQIASFVPLDAQRAWTAELGGRGQIGIARWDVSLYRADIKGEMLQFTVSPDIPASTFNSGRTRHQGVEAALDLDLAPWARLRQAYQFNDFRFRNDPSYGDNRLPVAPKHLYRAELRIGSEAIQVAPNIEWVPEGAWADYANSLKVGGYTLVGLTAEARLKEGLTLFLDARNLGASKAIGDISAVIAATPASIIFNPVERRAVYGGLRARF